MYFVYFDFNVLCWMLCKLDDGYLTGRVDDVVLGKTRCWEVEGVILGMFHVKHSYFFI